jgi:hypothetical protein
MYENAKQARSVKRIDALLNTADRLLCEESKVSDISIALLTKEAGLKSKYLVALTSHIKKSQFSLEDNSLHKLCSDLVDACFDFFNENLGATKLLLGNSFLHSVDKDAFKDLSDTVLNKFENKTNLPNMFDKHGVFLVTNQILLAVMSLNYRQNNLLNDTGKKEALRASHAYLISCTTK